MPLGRLRRILPCLLWAAAGWPSGAQQSLPDLRLTLFGGPAFHTGAPSLPFELGISGDMALLHPRGRGFGLGALVEGGLFHPALSGSGNYDLCVDGMISRLAARETLLPQGLQPFAVAGYSRMFNATTSAIMPNNAVNFGVGLDHPITREQSLRIELREHYSPFTNSHALVLRLGLVSVIHTE